MQDTSTEELDQEIISFGYDLTYGWSGNVECLYNVLEEQAKKNPALEKLWKHKRDEAKRIAKKFKGCKSKPKWKKPM